MSEGADKNILDSVRDACHRAHDQAMSELADIIVQSVRDDISEAFPPASSPGQPPHSRTGNLLRGVGQETERQGGQITATLTSSRAGGDPRVPTFLNSGTRKMAPRPYWTMAQTEWASKGQPLFADSVRANFNG